MFCGFVVSLKRLRLFDCQLSEVGLVILIYVGKNIEHGPSYGQLGLSQLLIFGVFRVEVVTKVFPNNVDSDPHLVQFFPVNLNQAEKV